MLDQNRLGNHRSDAAWSCKPNYGHDQVNEEDQEVAHAASYQNQKTLSIRPRSAIRQGQVKQYHKEGRALRTETTINNTLDFGIGKRIHNLPALREVGFQANRRLLETERITHDCIMAEEAF